MDAAGYGESSVLRTVVLEGHVHAGFSRSPEAQAVAREGVEDEMAGRVRASLAEDAIEVGAAREPSALTAPAGSTLAGSRHYGVRRARPLCRRRLSIARPARVRMRPRKPWVRARLRFLGW